jgi:hypothetical protein
LSKTSWAFRLEIAVTVCFGNFVNQPGRIWPFLEDEKMSTILVLASLLSLAGSEWGMGGSEQYIQFSEGRVAGHSGCNRYTGSFTQDGDSLKLGPLASTKMACPPERMEQEQTWFQMLDKVRGFDATHLVLKLKAADGKVIATLQRRDFD